MNTVDLTQGIFYPGSYWYELATVRFAPHTAPPCMYVTMYNMIRLHVCRNPVTPAGPLSHVAAYRSWQLRSRHLCAIRSSPLGP